MSFYRKYKVKRGLMDEIDLTTKKVHFCSITSMSNKNHNVFFQDRSLEYLLLRHGTSVDKRLRCSWNRKTTHTLSIHRASLSESTKGFQILPSGSNRNT